MRILIAGFLIMCALGSQETFAQTQSNCQINETYFIKREGARVILNPENSGVGQQSVTAHTISKERGGEKIGVTITKRVNLGMASLTPGVDGIYEISTTAFLPNGLFVTLSAVDADKDTYSKTVEKPIIGGTGRYTGARGTITTEPLKDSQTFEYKITLNAEVLCKKLK